MVFSVFLRVCARSRLDSFLLLCDDLVDSVAVAVAIAVAVAVDVRLLLKLPFAVQRSFDCEKMDREENMLSHFIPHKLDSRKSPQNEK